MFSIQSANLFLRETQDYPGNLRAEERSLKKEGRGKPKKKVLGPAQIHRLGDWGGEGWNRGKLMARKLDWEWGGRARREKIWCRHSNGLSPAPPEAHSTLSCRNTFLIKAYKSCFVRTSPHPIDFKMVNQASSPFDAHKSMATACIETAASAARAE